MLCATFYQTPLNFKSMRLVFSFAIAILFMFCLGCKTNTMTGVYICDQSQKKADTSIRHENGVERSLDLTCIIQEIDFKGNSTVELKMSNGPYVTSYITDKGYIRVKGTGSDILFKIKDGKTLSGEGIAQGLYYKK
jgi:hypothetical protein